MLQRSLVRRVQEVSARAFDRVLLVISPSIFLLDERVFASLGILKVAASLEKGNVAVEMLDLSGIANYTDAVEAYVSKTSARVMGFTATTPQLPAVVKIVEVVRRVRPDMRLVLGGPHSTLVHSAVKLERKQGRIARAHAALAKLETLFDVIVSGDGEVAIFEALMEKPPKIVDADDPKSGMFMSNESYDESPFPARHLIDLDSYKYEIDGHRSSNVIAQLGCPFACSFSLTGDTLISTDRGDERLEDLVIGQGVTERCEHGGVVRVHRIQQRIATRDGWASNVEAVDEGLRPVFVVSAENGSQVRATAEHELLVASDSRETLDWREVRHLEPGAWLVLKEPDVDGYRYTRVTSVVPGAVERVYDLRVPESHSFLANGFVSHNCGGRSSNMLRRIRTRTTASVVRELEDVYRTYGYTGYMCYDKTTEILTEDRGFIKFSDLSSTDRVAVLDRDTGEMRFEKPKRFIRQHFNGFMCIAKSKFVDLLVTPEHRMWIQRLYSSKYEFMTASELVTKDKPVRFYQRAEWIGEDVSHFEIPAYEVRYLGRGRGSPKIQVGTRKFASAVWVQFMAWYLSEGSCYRPKLVKGGRGYRICIKQSFEANPHHVDEIHSVLRALGYKYSYSSDQFHIDSKELYEYLAPFGHAADKYVPPEFKRMSRELQLLFIKTYIKGDGHTAKRNGQETILSTSRRMRDDLQEMAIKAGYWASLDAYNRVLLKRQGESLANEKRRDALGAFSILPYDGDVFCVTVSTGVVLVRRNGKAVWCGNCHDDELNVNREMVTLMREISNLQKRLGVEFRLRGFVKAELFTDEQAAVMYEAGFRWLLCGFEGANPRILENINKKSTIEDNARVVEICHRHGLKIKALMSVGHAGETEQSILDVRDWLIQVKPDDFDCTVITTYPGTPYYDEAIPHASLPGVWTFTAKKSGDRLHAYELDYTETADYYKGDPNGGYVAYVFTDHLSSERIVELRDTVERDVRTTLKIPFYPSAAARRYEHSMGQGEWPPFILRRSDPT